ncbi:MAG: hypothetical protein PHW74_09330 [Desulfobacca sp.]|nr:hypothetical protein [Desulfobacca sp.]
MPICLDDKPEEMKDYQDFRKQARGLEQEYLDLRKELCGADSARHQDPSNPVLQAKVEYLKKRLRGLEQQAPWLAAEMPPDIAVWGH